MTTILTSLVKRSPARAYGARALVALGLVAVLGAAAGCGSEPVPPQTGRVERGTVVTKVSASGSLTAIREKNLGFPKGGELKEVLVKVGDRVSAGQVLARTDDFALRQTLDQMQAQLNSQQALFGRLVNATTVEGAKATLDQAQQILSATQQLVDTQLSSDSAAADQARRQLDFDSFLLGKAQEQLRADQVSCAATGGIPYTPPPPGTSSTGNNGSATPDGPDSSVGVGPAQAGVENPVQAGPVSAGVPGAGPGGGGNGNPACNRIPADQQAVVTARRQVLSDKTALDAAQQKLSVDRASGLVSIENARQSVVTAQNNLDAVGSERPFNIDQQVALVASAQAAVAAAQRDVDNTVLRAPVAGTVSAVNGVVGEYVSPSSNTSPLAPGTDAPIPGLTGSAANSSLGLGNPATGAQRPGGTQFLVLSEINTFQVVVPFEESDAAKVAPNQKVDVTFDAVPDLTRVGTVVAVSPTGSSISSVINYYVTVVLNETDPRLKDGQTAQARVVTNQVEDVLTVPNSAVRKRGDQSSVTVVDADGVEQQVRFQAGLVGDDRTQVISGLKEGQQVVLREGV